MEFDIIGEGISSLTALWNVVNNDTDDTLMNLSSNNRNKHLKDVYCERNKIKSGGELDKCTSVNFHCNLLRNLNGLPHFPRIKELNLSSNNLGNEELSHLSLLPSLTSLDISANKFSDLSILPFIPSLLKLSIAYNPIKTLEDINESVPNLEYLDVRGHNLNNSNTDKCSYLRSRQKVVVPLKGLTNIRELHITTRPDHDNAKNIYDNDSYASELYNLTQQILSLEMVDGMSPMDWKADADEAKEEVNNRPISSLSSQPLIDIDNIATPIFDQVSSIFKSKLLNESAEKPELSSIIEEKEDDKARDCNDNNEIPLVIGVEIEDKVDGFDENDLITLSTSSSPMMKTKVILETKNRDTNGIQTLSVDNCDSKVITFSPNQSDVDDIIIRVDRSTGQLVSRKKGSPMLLSLVLFKLSMKFENRQLSVALRRWRNETIPKNIDYTNVISSLTNNNNDLLATLENEREKNKLMTKDWEKRLEVEKNKYSNASKKVLQQEAMLMGVRRDLEEKIRYNTQVEVNTIKDISAYKDIIINKDAEIEILKKQLAEGLSAMESANKREEDLQNKLMLENEKEVRFQGKYDEWMSSREALILSVEQSQSALSLALEREAILTTSCQEHLSIINTLEEQIISLDKTIIVCNEKIAMQETELSSSKIEKNAKMSELDEANNLNTKLVKRLQDTQRAFEESLTELSITSKKNIEMNKQKDVYCNTINSLRSCVRKMQESLQVKEKENLESQKSKHEKQQKYDDEKSLVITNNIQSRLETLELGLVSRTEELFKAKDDVRTLTESCKEKDLALRVKETMLADHAITIQELKNKLHVADKEIKQLQRALEELQGTVEEVRLDNIELETEIQAKSRVEKEMKLLLEEINEVGFGKKSY